MAEQRHTKFRDKLIRRLNQRPDWFAWKVNQLTAKVGKRFIRTGPDGQPDLYAVKSTEITPDMVGMRLGVLVGIEIKVGADQQRDTQRNWQKLLESRNAVYRVIRFSGRKKDGAVRHIPKGK